ncbi:MAG: rhodanese-like domain-containing protein [Caldilineaceae bacterium]
MSNLLIIFVLAVVAFLVFNLIKQRSGSVNSNVTPLSPQQYQQQFKQSKTPHLLLDVRTPEEFASEHIKGAVNIPVQVLPQRLQDVPKDKPVVLICRSGNRTRMAAQILTQANYTNVYDLGGLMHWKAAGMPMA